MSILGSGSLHMQGRFAKPLASKEARPGAGEPRCQKCLQTGHWTYECKGQATYLARPSASKQLHNPSKRKYLDPEEVPEWMRFTPKELEEKKKAEAEARRKARKKKHKHASSSSSSSSSDSDTSSGSSSDTSSSSGTSSSSSGSDSSSSGSSGSSSSSSDSSSSSGSDSSTSSDSSGGRGKAPPRKRAKQQADKADSRPEPTGRERGREDRRGGGRSGRDRSPPADAADRAGPGSRGRHPGSASPPGSGGRRPDGKVDGRAAAAYAEPQGGKQRSGRGEEGARGERDRRQREEDVRQRADSRDDSRGAGRKQERQREDRHRQEQPSLRRGGSDRWQPDSPGGRWGDDGGAEEDRGRARGRARAASRSGSSGRSSSSDSGGRRQPLRRGQQNRSPSRSPSGGARGGRRR